MLCPSIPVTFTCSDYSLVGRQLHLLKIKKNFLATWCGILVPRPGIEPAAPKWESVVLTTGPPGKSPHLHF